MLAGTVTQFYTWQWAKDQSIPTIVQHLSLNPHEIMQNLAADASRTKPNESILTCSIKILKALNICDFDFEKLNEFTNILKKNGFLSPSEKENVKLFTESILSGNLAMAKNILVNLGPINHKMLDPYELIRRGLDNREEEVVVFLLENNMITSRSLFKSIFGSACERKLFKVLEFMTDPNSASQIPHETIEFNLREAIRKENEPLVTFLIDKFKISVKHDENSKTNLLNFTCCLKPENPKLVGIIIDAYKKCPDFIPQTYANIVNKACKKAAIFGNCKTVIRLIQEKATIDLGIISSLLYQREDEFVLSLLERFPQGESYYDILMVAIRVGAEFVVVKLLTDYEQEILKTYPTPAEDFYLTLLEISFKDRNVVAAYHCMERCKKPIPQILLDSMIAHALSNESEGLLLVLLENNLLHRSNYFMLLMHCARLGFMEAAKILIRRQVNLNRTDKGLTPLLVAVANNHLRMVDLLIYAGSKIDVVDLGGNTALHYAAFVGSEVIVKLLIDRGLNVNSLNKLDETPLHLAASEGCENAVRILLQNGANRMAQNQNGEIPLHQAINSVHPSQEMIDSLISSNESLAIPDHLGRTPFAMLLKKNMLKSIRQFFFPFVDLSSLNEAVTELDRTAVYHLPRILSPHNMSSALPLELAFLMNHYPLARAIAGRYSLQEWEAELQQLGKKYPKSNLNRIRDAKYDLHPAHFLEGVPEIASEEHKPPIFPAQMDFIRQRIVDAFDQINFTQKTGKGYRDPDSLSNDGESITPDEIRDGLIQLFLRVKNRVPFVGTPPANSADLAFWYDKLERLLYDLSQVVLKKSEKDEQASLLIEMGIAGLHCGGRWIGTLRQLLQFETNDSKIHTLPEMLKIELKMARRGILESLVQEGNVHQYNHFMYLVGEELGLIAKNTRDKYKDALADVNETQETLLTKFYKQYHPTFIIDMILAEINNVARTEEKRNVLIDWFKENVPDNWRTKEDPEDRVYSFVLASLYDEKQRFCIHRSAVIYLLHKFNVLC